MGWQDRDYASDEGYSRAVGRRGFHFPAQLQLSTILIIINVGVYILDSLTRSANAVPLIDFGAMYTPAVLKGEIWRLITSQYLHAGVMHLFFNMLGLYFLGRYLEQYWGRRKFFIFYTACGLAGNLFFLSLNLIGWLGVGYAIGASGCILGVLGACAVLFPGIQLIIYFFPMKIRTAAALFLGLYVLNLLQKGPNAGGDAAHLAGLLVGSGYAYFRRRGAAAGTVFRRKTVKVVKKARPTSPWRRKLEQEEQFNEQVDRILSKIKEQGIASLTRQEKEILAKASQQQRAEAEEFGRLDRL